MQLITLILCALATAAPIHLNRYVKGALIGGTAAVGLTVAWHQVQLALNAANDAQLYKGLINAGSSISRTPVPSVAEAALGGTVIGVGGVALSD
jgi:hypothetical protein